jgi:hypothetical protein
MQRPIDGQPADAAVENTDGEMGIHPQITQITQKRQIREGDLS